MLLLDIFYLLISLNLNNIEGLISVISQGLIQFRYYDNIFYVVCNFNFLYNRLIFKKQITNHSLIIYEYFHHLFILFLLMIFEDYVYLLYNNMIFNCFLSLQQMLYSDVMD